MNYYCQWCDKTYEPDQVKHREEDNTFSAPYGDTSRIEGDIDKIPVCVECDEDLEEIV